MDEEATTGGGQHDESQYDVGRNEPGATRVSACDWPCPAAPSPCRPVLPCSAAAPAPGSRVPGGLQLVQQCYSPRHQLDVEFRVEGLGFKV